MNYFFLSLLMIICGGFCPLLFLRSFTLMRATGAFIIAAGCLVGLVDAGAKLFCPVAAQAVFGFQDAFTLAFAIDGLSAFFLVAIFAVCLLAAVYSFHYMSEPRQAVRIAVHYLCFSLLIIAMALVVTAGNIIAFVLCWEIMSLASLCLVLYDYEKAENRRAAYLYAVFSQAGVMFIIAAFGVMYAHTGSFDFAAASGLAEKIKILVFVLAFVGFGSKAGVFPLHVWLPYAHPAASSHVSAVMSGVMIKTGIYGIVRLYDFLAWPTPLFGQIVLIAGLVSGLLGVIYALGQSDIKRLLAYCSMENVGIILIGIGLGMIGVAAGKPIMAVLGFAGGLLHVLNHAIFKSLLFMGAGMVLHQTGTRAMDLLGGLIKKMPVTGTTFLIGALAIAGLPPLNGFVSEFLIYMGAFKGAALGKADFVLSLLSIVTLAFIGGLALATFTKVFGVVFQGEPRSAAAMQVAEHGTSMLVPMGVLAAACVAIGLFPSFFMTMAIQAVAALDLGYGRIPLAPFVPLTANISRGAAIFLGVCMVVGVLRLIAYRGKSITRAGTWGCGFTQPTARMQYTGASYAASILDFFKAVVPMRSEHPAIRDRFPARTYYMSQLHDIAEVHIGRLIVRPVVWLFDRLRWVQAGDIHMYVGFVFLAIVVALFFV